MVFLLMLIGVDEIWWQICICMRSGELFDEVKWLVSIGFEALNKLEQDFVP